MKDNQLPGLRSLYTVSDLADMANITKGRMRRLLEGCGVEFTKIGRKDHVGIAELENKCGSMWASAKLLKHFQDIEREHQDSIRMTLDDIGANQ